jgi:hypothetical protein
MCEAVGHRVIALRRIAFGPLRLGELAPGKHRRLSAPEVKRLRAAAAQPRAGGAQRAAAAQPRGAAQRRS